MVVGQNYCGGVGTEGGFHNLSDGNGGRIHTALSQFLAAQHFAFGIQAEQKHRFFGASKKPGHQISSAGIQRGEDLRLLGTVYLIIPAKINHQGQQRSCMILDSRNLFQVLHICFQHLGKAAEMIQQGMGNGIGIRPWNGIEQQQFQHLNICEIVQTFFQETLLQPLPVAFVDGFCCHTHHQKSVLLFLRFPARIKMYVETRRVSFSPICTC